MTFTREYAVYEDDGRIGLYLSPDGLPQMTSLLPAPWMTEEERTALVEATRKSAAYDGLWIESERRIRNVAFDRRGEKTTTRFVTRPCRNSVEADRLRVIINGYLAAARLASDDPQPGPQ